MSHNINTMMYAGETPWHQLGTYVGQKEITSREAIIKAGLDWEVELVPLVTATGLNVDMKKAVVRKDTQVALGVVGNQYQPYQNTEAFAFLDSLVGRESAVYHTAGALGNGERIWILIKLPDVLRVGKDDIIEKYFLATNSHDGMYSIKHLFTPIRVVCQNTLKQAIATGLQQDAIHSIKHTGKTQEHLNNLRNLLMESNTFFNKLQEMSGLMLQKKLNYRERNDYYTKCLNITDEAGQLTSRGKNVLETVHQLEEYGKGTELPGVKGSLWGSYNAVVEYIDFSRVVKGSKNDPTKRIDSIVFGNGRNVKETAWDEAVVLVS